MLRRFPTIQSRTTYARVYARQFLHEGNRLGKIYLLLCDVQLHLWCQNPADLGK
jgi:hypothetical protein